MMFRPRLILIGWPVEPTPEPAAIVAEIAIRNRALEAFLRAKRAETTAKLIAERGGL